MKAEVIADSICITRITTLELTMPKWLVAQLNTHRCFSRNSASSRAIPLKKLRAQVLENPYVPSTWPRNQKGMQGGEALDASHAGASERAWRQALSDACKHHEWLEHLGVHKEIANRLLEPFMWTKVLVTSTEWENFFKLRLPGAGAQHEMGRLALAMQQAIYASEPAILRPGDWHLPFTQSRTATTMTLAQSVARAARVSYMNHGKQSSYSQDYDLSKRLHDDGHWSPFEHQAVAMETDESCANFRGWKQYRTVIEEKS
jgi:thymidylate synthase ThyX